MQRTRSGRKVLWLAALAAISSVLAGSAAQIKTPEFSALVTRGDRQLVDLVANSMSARLASFDNQRGSNAAAGHDADPIVSTDDLNILGANPGPLQQMGNLQPEASPRQPIFATLSHANLGCWVMPLPEPDGVTAANDCNHGFSVALKGLSALSRLGPIANATISPSEQSAARGADGDVIGSLIRSLNRPSPIVSASFDPPPVPVLRVLPPALSVTRPANPGLAELVEGSCTGDCPAYFNHLDAKPLAAALSIDRDGMQHGGGGDSGAGQQNGNGSGQGSSGGSGGTGTGSGGSTGGSGDGSSSGDGSGAPSGGSDGSGDGQNSGDGPGHGHGHGHGHSGP